MVWKFGKKIFEKIEAEKKPVIGEPHEPFDLLDGKAFAIVVTKVAGFNNYDQSRFLDKRIPLLLPDQKTGKLLPINDKTPRETVFNFLKENSPDLNKYGFKEWDQETHEYVNQVILAVTGQTPSSAYADLRNSKSTPDSNVSKASPSSSGISSTDLSLEDLGSGDFSSLPDLNLPDLNTENNFGIGGDLNDVLNNI